MLDWLYSFLFGPSTVDASFTFGDGYMEVIIPESDHHDGALVLITEGRYGGRTTETLKRDARPNDRWVSDMQEAVERAQSGEVGLINIRLKESRALEWVNEKTVPGEQVTCEIPTTSEGWLSTTPSREKQ